MNRYAALGCLGLGLMVSPFLGGMATSAVPSPKIGVVDFDSTLVKTPAGKRLNDSFEKVRKQKQADLDKQKNALDQDAADLEKQKSVLKPDAYEQKYQTLQKRFYDLNQTYVKLEADLETEKDKLVQDFMSQATPKIAKLAHDEGVNIIVFKHAILWSEGVDLTDKVNALMQ